MAKRNPRTTTEGVLYILMRTDMTSMNAGKAMAQAAHAANAFVHRMNQLQNTVPLKLLYKRWAKSTDQGFGTTIVLGAPMSEILSRFGELDARMLSGDEPYVWDVAHDPTYPLKDGDVLHQIPLDTCAYLFCLRDGGVKAFFYGLPLHP